MIAGNLGLTKIQRLNHGFTIQHKYQP